MTGFLDETVLDAISRAASAAAAAAAPLAGSGDPDAVDAAAVASLRRTFGVLPVAGRIVVGEGEKDAAPMLEAGETFGTGGPEIDVAIDPIDGTRAAAAGLPGAMTVLAVAPRDGFADLRPAFYLQKLVSRVPGLSLLEPIADTLARIAEAEGRELASLRVAVQDRPRNAPAAEAVTLAGAQLELFEHGDIERSFRVLTGELDLLLGIGGAPEGIITAAAARVFGGWMTARPAPQDPLELARVAASVPDPERERGLDELCPGPAHVFVASATGVDLGGGIRLPAVAAGGRVAGWFA